MFGAGFKAILSPSSTTAGIPVNKVVPLLFVKNVCMGVVSDPAFAFVIIFWFVLETGKITITVYY